MNGVSKPPSAGELLTVLRKSARERARVLVSYSWRREASDPHLLFERARHRGDACFWSPEPQLALVGLGSAATLRAEGAARFAELRGSFRQLCERARAVGPAPQPLRALAGFSFDPARRLGARWAAFGDARLVVPELWLRHDAEGTIATLSAEISPASDLERVTQRWVARASQRDMASGRPAASLGQLCTLSSDTDAFVGRVRRATERIRRGDLQKVVLAREVTVAAGRPFDLGRALAALGVSHPRNFRFALALGRGNQDTQGEGEPGACFVSCTPERLLLAREGRIFTSAVAGTRGLRQTAAGMDWTGRFLGDEKERAEHAYVVDMLAAELSRLCSETQAPGAPELLAQRFFHHLHTPLSGRLKPGIGALDVLEALHPTPAVGGSPRQAALTFIREHEGLDRGWYASAVGLLEGEADGELAVAVRSGLVEGARATLFAGGGIVAGSEPARELEETELKLEVMRSALRCA